MIGYVLCCEEHGPRDLVRHARMAEEMGFRFAFLSDHFHPWIDAQGHSPFVWGVLGAIAQATERLEIGTGVTCPILRFHPALVAHAAATAACLLEDRFFLGVGTGENLNEHVLGQPWPPPSLRLEMLEEAVAVIRLLWEGGYRSHRGRHFTVERARLYDLPRRPPPLFMAASGPRAARLAGRLADGLIALDPEVLPSFEQGGGRGKPRWAQLTVCWAEDRAQARRTAHRLWPTAALPGTLFAELDTPARFEEAAMLVREEDVAAVIPCGPDPEEHAEALRRLLEAGFDRVAVHQVGPHQEGFARFYRREVLPRLG